MPVPNQEPRKSQMPPRQTAPAQTQHRLPEVRYFENETLRPELLDEEALRVGQALADQGLKSAQLRRFYGDVLGLRRRFETESGVVPPEQRESIFQEILPEFRLLRAKAYYAHKRKIIPDVMKQFVQQHVDAVKTSKDFLAFCRHFEAVVAYHYFFAKE